MKIRANGIYMNYEIKGDGENLVMIHGMGDNLNMWYHQIPVFSKSFRVITYDVRGFGKTESPEGEYSTLVFADDLGELMKALGVRSGYFLGYSMGGRIALELAIKYPELVKALIIANSSFGLIPPSPQSIERRRAMLPLLESGDMKAVAETMTTSAFSPGFRTRNPAEFDRYMKVKLQNTPEGQARVLRSMVKPSGPSDLSKVKCPVLMIAGDSDANMNLEDSRQAQKAIAGSKLLILHTGHASAIESPQEFNSAVIEFLIEAGQLKPRR